MASNYKILSAFSDSGANLYIPISWDFDKVSDLSVIIVDDNGNAKPIDYWTWNSTLKQVEIKNTQGYKYWAGYVMRHEDSATVLQAVASMEVNAQNIIEQFKKTNRIIEQIQEVSKTTLRSPDYIEGILPNATKRAKRFLSFDENGNPICEIGTAEFDDAKASTNLAMQEAQNAKANAENAQRKSELAQANAEDAQRKSELAQNASEFAQNIAEKAAKSSGLSATNSAQSAEDAVIAKGKAEDAQAKAEEAQEKCESLRNESLTSATNAMSSATSASMSASLAQTAQTKTEKLVGDLSTGKTTISKMTFTVYDENGKEISQNATLKVVLKDGIAVIRLESEGV